MGASCAKAAVPQATAINPSTFFGAIDSRTSHQVV
jgi:hypothetical protein